jgi:2-dehydro-3-deoxygluconokinase
VKISYDSNLRLRLWPIARARAIICETIRLSDYFFPSMEDAEALADEKEPERIVDWCHGHGARAVLLKLGKDGVLVSPAPGAARVRVPGFRVDAVDATGAGDCFAGALIARLVAGDDVFAAARYANAAAGLTTTGYGAVAPIPRPDAVRKLLETAAA